MKAKELAALLMEHPEAEVFALNNFIEDWWPVHEMSLEYEITWEGLERIWVEGCAK